MTGPNTSVDRRERKLAAIAYLGGACVDCGDTYDGRPEVFDFDHRFDKRDKVGHLITNCSWARLEAELDKCDLVCTNCHRTRTVERHHFGVALCE